MAITAAFLRRIRKALPPVLIVCCVGAGGALMRGAAASRSAASASLTSGPTMAGCASPYNYDDSGCDWHILQVTYALAGLKLKYLKGY